MTTKQWNEYHGKIVNFRNEYIAHTNGEYNQPVPFMDKAIDICISYLRIIQKLFKEEGIVYLDDIEEYIQSGKDEIDNVLLQNFPKYSKNMSND